MRFLIISVFAVIFFCLPSAAQQTVFNVPSADVTPEGAIFFAARIPVPRLEA